MKERNYTKGPWKYVLCGTSINGASIIGADGIRVATLTRNADKSLDQKISDARLISAAPDLLESLESMLFMWNRLALPQIDQEQNDRVDKILETARAAIEKATG